MCVLPSLSISVQKIVFNSATINCVETAPRVCENVVEPVFDRAKDKGEILAYCSKNRITVCFHRRTISVYS